MTYTTEAKQILEMSMEAAIARADAAIEMTPEGQLIAYDASLNLEPCWLSSECPCSSCRAVFDPVKGNTRGQEDE